MLRPDVFLNPGIDAKKEFANNARKLISGFELKWSKMYESAPIPDFTKTTIQIDSVKVIDNHTGTLWWDRDADIYLIGAVITNKADTPIVINTLDNDRVFNGIRDENMLSITNHLTLSRIYNGIPDFIDLHLAVMKSNEHSRNFNKYINESLESEQGKSLTSALTTLLTTSNPLLGSISAMGTSLLSLVTDYLSKREDEQIFYGVSSFELYPDNLGMGKKWHMTDNKNADIEFQIVGSK